jgi:hypothetical protein
MDLQHIDLCVVANWQVMLEEAQLAKHAVIKAAEVETSELQNEILKQQGITATVEAHFAGWRTEHLAIIEDLKKKLEFQKVRTPRLCVHQMVDHVRNRAGLSQLSNSEQVQGLMAELQDTNARLAEREKTIEENTDQAKKAAKDAAATKQKLMTRIAVLVADNVDVQKAAEAMVAGVRAEAEAAKAAAKESEDTIEKHNFALKIKNEQIKDAKLLIEKQTEEVAAAQHDAAVFKARVPPLESSLKKEHEVCVKLEEELRATQVAMAAGVEDLASQLKTMEQEYQESTFAWTTKLEKEKEKNKKIVAAKDEQLKQLRETIVNFKQQLLELRGEYHELDNSTQLTIKGLKEEIEQRDQVIAQQKTQLESAVRHLHPSLPQTVVPQCQCLLVRSVGY